MRHTKTFLRSDHFVIGMLRSVQPNMDQVTFSHPQKRNKLQLTHHLLCISSTYKKGDSEMPEWLFHRLTVTHIFNCPLL